MPVGGSFNLIDTNILIAVSKIAVLLILAFYVIFAILIVRQVSLMNKTFMTAISPLLKDLAIYHVLFSMVLIVLVWKFL